MLTSKHEIEAIAWSSDVARILDVHWDGPALTMFTVDIDIRETNKDDSAEG